jgi:signal transduction histidine kinase/ligand-binding sensor domain-containing protein
VVLGFVCLAFCTSVWADGTELLQPDQYVHQSWTIRDGAPPAVCALAQAPDGYLWLGTGTGLYRFDGVQFAQYRPKAGQSLVSSNITALKFVANGGLWIGFYDGGAAFLKDGKLTAYSAREGFPPGWVLDFAEGNDGQIWVATGQGLARFDGVRWHLVGGDWNYPADRADWVAFDKSGTLWAAAINQLVYLRPGAKRFQATNVALAPGAVLGVDKDGTLWVSDRLHGTRPLRGLSADHPNVSRIELLPVTEEDAAARFTFDRHGGLWASGLRPSGVLHVARPDRIALGQNISSSIVDDVFIEPRGVTSNRAIPVIEDHEGNIWVGTNLGIDSYRRGPVGTLRAPLGAHMGVAKDSQGNIWVSSEGSVYRVTDDRPTRLLKNSTDILSLLFAGDDTLWVVGFHDLYRAQASALEKIPLPNDLYSSRLKFVVAGKVGEIWVSIEALGIFKFSHNVWTSWTPHTRGLPVSPTAGAVDSDGSMWFGYIGGDLLHVDNSGRETFYDSNSDVDIGTIETISIGPRETIFGGDSGLARLHAGVIQSITDRDFPVLTSITGIAQTRSGDVWINTGRGVVRYSAAELDRAFDNPLYRPTFEQLDYRDGVQGVARQGQPVSTIQSDAQGRIWFVTNDSLQWIDPAKQFGNPYPPPVYVKSVWADGKQYDPGDAIKLPAGVTSLQIEYTALSFSSPRRVQFRYRLDGVDKEWINPGTRRQAYYTNLSPGSYRFSVIASNNDGVWNDQGAQIIIDLPPRFYQTRWFEALETLVVVALAAMAYFARIRRVTRNIHLQSEARYEERERIARELHDTLLQAVHALMLRFQALAAAIPEKDPLQEGIASTLKVANSFIIEGRDRVKALRSRLNSTKRMSDAIVQLALGLEKASSTVVETQVRIEDREIDPTLSDNIFSICREGLVNAFRHANASLISLHVAGSKRHVHITITDNGKGIAPSVLENLVDNGYWGILGMRERASQSGVKLLITSSPAGTTINIEATLR